MIRRTSEPRRPRWATLPHAAEYFDCTPETIRTYISAGDVPGYHVGKRRTIKVDLNDLDDLAVRIPSAIAGPGPYPRRLEDGPDLSERRSSKQ